MGTIMSTKREFQISNDYFCIVQRAIKMFHTFNIHINNRPNANDSIQFHYIGSFNEFLSSLEHIAQLLDEDLYVSGNGLPTIVYTLGRNDLVKTVEFRFDLGSETVTLKCS